MVTFTKLIAAVSNSEKKPNLLIHSLSPYLQQHAYNPVEWHEWNAETLAKAKALKKPLLVSIGYSSCHWCHLMEHESFEDRATAELMNNFFINIKVDREERPDIDQVYMDACQLVTGKGGWPLNAFCLPDGRPIHAGTYFPQASWQQVLLQIHELITHRPADAEDYAQKLTEGIAQMETVEMQSERKAFTRSDIDELYTVMSRQFDRKEGGPNRAPKFPLPNNYDFLLNYHLHGGNADALEFTQFTLIKMANGGIYDQAGGGFARYSTDARWFAPHFEKMLYDNAQLISLYSRAYAVNGVYLFKDIVSETIRFCQRELLHEEGAFMSALDADTEGIEGRYYVFTWQELQDILGDQLSAAAVIFNLSEKGNWEHGYNILHKTLSPAELVNQLGNGSQEYFRLLEEIKGKLLAAREQRVRPGLDYKVLTSWNGLMIRGLAEAAIYCGDNDALNHANRAWHFITTRMVNAEGNLLHSYAKGEARISAFLEDYAALIQGGLALHKATQNEEILFFCKQLTESALDRFFDDNTRLFWFTSDDAHELVARKKDLTDDVISSANSMMAGNLLQLGYYFSNTHWIRLASDMLSSVSEQLRKFPAWYSCWAQTALQEAFGTVQIVCTGANAVKNLSELMRMTDNLVPAVADVQGNSRIPLAKGKYTGPENRIYICYNQHCMEPVQTVEQAAELLADCGYAMGE